MSDSGGFGGDQPFAGLPSDVRHDPAGPHAPYPPAGWATPQTSTSAAVALGLAVLSWVAIPLVPAIVAVILARNAHEEIAASGGRVTGARMADAARVAAWANIAFSGVLLVVVLIVLVVIGGVLL